MKKEFEYTCIAAIGIKVNLICATSPILWNNEGRFGLIPLARIQNAFENWKDTHIGSTLVPVAKFYWSETIKISPQIANALLGEDKDDKCTYNSKGSTKGS